jgi:hypothetical protein
LEVETEEMEMTEMAVADTIKTAVVDMTRMAGAETI